MKRFALLLLFAVAGTTACGASNPASPSSSSSGATISGTINSLAGSAGSFSSQTGFTAGGTGATVPGGISVNITGTNISAVVDNSGHFELKGVPNGNVELKFTGSGFNAAVTITDVSGAQTITVTITLTSTLAVIDSEHRSMPGEEQVEGRVEALPTTPVNSLVVAGRTITTDMNTIYWMNGAPATFANLAVGQRVHVKGQPSTGSVLAREIKIQNDDDGLVPINGVISGFSGTASAFQFTVNGQLVKGDALTQFYGNSTFQQLADGASVEVKGQLKNGYVYAVRLHVEDGAEVTVLGRLNSIVPAPPITQPLLTLTVGTTTVKTTALTDVQRKGDKQDLSVLVIGMTLEVEGSLMADGTTVLAKKIKIEGDEANGAFQMQGSVGGLAGACPTKSFSVSGYLISTDSLTTYLPTAFGCSALTNGLKVEVKGIVQSDGSIKATSVEKK